MVRGRRVLTAVVAGSTAFGLAGLTACSSATRGEGPELGSAPGSTMAGSEAGHALLFDGAWALQEAVDPPADDPFAAHDKPPLEWWAEYVRAEGPARQLVRLSGHRGSLDQVRAQLQPHGSRFADVAVDGWRAIGATEQDPVSPAILALDDGPWSVQLLSYDLTIDELAALLTIDDLAAMPSTTVDVTFASGAGPQQHTYRGVALLDLLASTGLTPPPAKNGALQVVVSATGSDGYQARVSVGEADPASAAPTSSWPSNRTARRWSCPDWSSPVTPRVAATSAT